MILQSVPFFQQPLCKRQLLLMDRDDSLAFNLWLHILDSVTRRDLDEIG
jgi:hypothetical protein